MSVDQLVPMLFLMTLGGVLAVAILYFLGFLSKRENREAVAEAFEGSEHVNERDCMRR